MNNSTAVVVVPGGFVSVLNFETSRTGRPLVDLLPMT